MAAQSEKPSKNHDEDLLDKSKEKSSPKPTSTVLTQSRHFEKIEATKIEAHLFLPKERMKTVSVALVLCLNIPVDPPDIVKPKPCARLQAWVDPLTMTPTKAIREIGINLQNAYAKWQPKARYKQSLDPTIEEVKKVCSSLRKNAKEERVLFHYNGHGVPKPTANGEIWVFNSTYTQYMPFSIYELQSWMGTPSIYVYDCSHAGIVVKCRNQHLNNLPPDPDVKKISNGSDPLVKSTDSSNNGNAFSSMSSSSGCSLSHIYQCIQLAACGANELLPMHPDLPADIFTACLTTPIKMAVRWHILQQRDKHLPGLSLDIIDKFVIPGQANDRRTIFGELNWIFTTITDTIAWNTLPGDLFQRLFRQDLLVASLFRNFLLAERVMRSYNCTPVSCPALPATHQNHMWHAWDLALGLCLNQLVKMQTSLPKEPSPIMSSFFQEQLTAFQVWLNLGDIKRHPPEQLPIVLQVLLSQVYRPRALELLGSFLALGPWAVNLVLNVGIFPYILKLLQSTARELKPLLIYLWAKILAVDPNCRNDLIREHAFKYFIPVLGDVTMPPDYKSMAAFVLTVMVNEHLEGQKQALRTSYSLQCLCLEQLTEQHAPLRQWLTICLGQSWHHYPDARWAATRNMAHEKLYKLLEDPVPEVRTAAVYALGTFISSLPIGDASDQAKSLNHAITITLANSVADDASPLVRRELVATMQFLIIIYESSYIQAAKQQLGESEIYSSMSSLNISTDSVGFSTNSLTRTPSKKITQTNILSPDRSHADTSGLLSPVSLTKTTSLHSLNSLGSRGSFSGISSLSYRGMYQRLWQTLLTLERDPFPSVSKLAHTLVQEVKMKVNLTKNRDCDNKCDILPGTPVKSDSCSSSETSTPTRSYSRVSQSESSDNSYPKNIVRTEFVEWSSRSFIIPPRERQPFSLQSKPVWMKSKKTLHSRFLNGESEHNMLSTSKLEDQVFIHKHYVPPSALLFHPSDHVLAVAGNDSISVWDLEQRNCIRNWNNGNTKSTISSMAILNPETSQSYMACGSSDGAVRIWRDVLHSDTVGNNEENTRNPTLVTAFQAMKEVTPSTRDTGLLMSWEQHQHTLIVSGDSNTVRLWDMEEERKSFEYQVESNIITALHSLDHMPYIVTGFADGSVCLLDRREKKSLVRQWREQKTWIISAQLYKSNSTSAKIIYAGASGEVRLCDIRQSSSVQVCQASQDITTMAYHPSAHFFALGSMQQINVHHASGSLINTIKYYDGFIGQRITPVSCLHFHPSKVLLAAATTDNYISVYGLKR